MKKKQSVELELHATGTDSAAILKACVWCDGQLGKDRWGCSCEMSRLNNAPICVQPFGLIQDSLRLGSCETQANSLLLLSLSSAAPAGTSTWTVKSEIRSLIWRDTHKNKLLLIFLSPVLSSLCPVTSIKTHTKTKTVRKSANVTYVISISNCPASSDSNTYGWVKCLSFYMSYIVINIPLFFSFERQDVFIWITDHSVLHPPFKSSHGGWIKLKLGARNKSGVTRKSGSSLHTCTIILCIPYALAEAWIWSKSARMQAGTPTWEFWSQKQWLHPLHTVLPLRFVFPP